MIDKSTFRDESIRLLQDLVRIDSTNGNEAKIAEYISKWFNTNKMKGSLDCSSHGKDLEVMKSTVGDNKKHIKENHEHGANDRRMIVTGIVILILGEIVMKIFL